jgi:3-methyladenine DNA glycosylase AlkC
LPQAGFAPAEVAALVAHARSLASEGVTVRVKKVSAKLHELLVAAPARRRRKLYDALAGHRSDMVRSLAGYTHLADETLELERRLALARRYAADPHMGVREGAWDSIRSWLAEDLERAFELLEPWARDPDPNVRRCAIEATRPRGVWTRHLEPLKQDPSPGLVLLEPCRSDSSDYVRRSVANWLNDASKSRPDWVKRLCARWLEESPTKETQWIVRRALRTVGRTRE